MGTVFAKIYLRLVAAHATIWEGKMTKFLTLLGEVESVQAQDWYTKILKPILDGVRIALIPIIIIAAAAGTGYAIWLGVKLAKADSDDERTEAKKKMIYFIIAFVVTIILLVVLQILASNVQVIYDLATKTQDAAA